MGAKYGTTDHIACEFQPKPLFALAVAVFVYYTPIAFMVTFYVRLYQIIRRTLRGTVEVCTK